MAAVEFKQLRIFAQSAKKLRDRGVCLPVDALDRHRAPPFPFEQNGEPYTAL